MAKSTDVLRASGHLYDIWLEFIRASEKFPPFNSPHEGYAVIDEEVEELKSAIYWGIDHRGAPSDPKTEAIQLGAMALRYLVDCAKD